MGIRPDEYVAKDGVVCPNCGSSDVIGGAIDIECCGAQQCCSCDHCRASWTDNYALTGYSELDVSITTDGGPAPSEVHQ